MKKRMMKEWMAGARERLVRNGESGQTYKGRMGRSARRAALVAAALLSCAGMSAGRVSAEGSRDIVRTSIENAKAISSGIADTSIARWSFSAIPNQSFMGVDKQQKIKFYAYAGEVVFFASNAVDDTTRDVIVTRPDGIQELFDLTKETKGDYKGGYIKDQAQEKAGPKGIYLPEEKKSGEAQTYNKVDDTGFEPYMYPVTQSGVYEVQFKADNQTNHTKYDSNAKKDVDDNVDQSKSDITKIKDAKNHVTAWDVTVTQPKTDEGNTEYYAVNGRVWMDAIMIQTGIGVYGNLYAVTRDGYIWKFSLNGMKPYTFSMYANARGGIGTGTNASVYHSVHDYRSNNTSFNVYNNLTDKNGNPDGLLIYGPDNEKTDIDAPCHMFVNMPDITMPDDIILSEAKEVGDIESIRYDGRSGEEDTAAGAQQGYVGVGGYFEVETKDATSYRIIIDMSNMYAKDYHGKSGSTVKCTGDDSHNEEICLSTPNDISFAYYNESKKTWYSIETSVPGKDDGDWDRHPFNEETDGSDPDTEFRTLIREVPINDGPVLNELKNATLGEDTENYKCLGKIMLGNAAVNGEKDRIKWNGRDQYGRILPIGAYFGDTGKGKVYAQAKGGEIHFPVGDVENMANGVAVWLENPPSSTINKATDEEYVDRASVYYNNSEKSLLRDNTGASINNALIWNLPKEDCFGDGDKWRTDLGTTIEAIHSNTELNFENMSIVGVLSHKYSDGDYLTKDACVLTDASDHGVVDIWTHVINDKQKFLSQPIYLYHYGTKKIITGFVYLDTPKVEAGIGTYDKMTDDKELPEAIITAEYGDGENRITYTTSTDTDGYYSIPIDMTRFTGTEKNVTLTVRYEDPNVTWEEQGESLVKKISTFKVSTALSSGNTQRIVTSPNISVQTVKLATSSGEAVPLKEIYAEQVGYTYVESKPVRIQKIWEPEYLKDNSMRAIFQIFGILKKDLLAKKTEDENRFYDPKFVVYESQEMQVNESLGGVSVVDTLPQCAYAMPAGYRDGEKVLSDKIQKDQDIVYRVKEDLKGSAVESILKEHNENYSQTNPDGKTITYDNWVYNNKISPSTFKEIVWYDLNNNGICEEEEQKIPGVEIEFLKEDETIQAVDGDIYAEDRYKEFDYASQDAMEALKDGQEIEEGSLINSKDISEITINKDGAYEFPGGLIAGRYLVRITLPKGAAYNTATYTGDGDPVLINTASETMNGSLITARTKERVIVTQYIVIDAGNNYEARVGYGYAGGLSIRKNVDVASAGEDEAIINEIEDEDFTFEIQLAEKPEGVGVVVIDNADKQKEVAKELGIPDDANLDIELPIKSCVVEAETFKLDIDNGTEIPEDKDKRIVFIENADYPGGSRWCSVFTLKSGERITIPNIDGNTEYWLWEYDNENNQTVEGQKNGSSTKESTTDAPLTYMPKGYSLAKLVGSSKMRNGRLPSTSRTVLVNYTNVYNPMPVKAFGGDGVAAKADGRFDIEKDAEGNPIEIDTALNIVADVKIEDSRINEGTLKDGEQQRYFQGSDVFKLLIEPVNSKIGDVESQENVSLFTSAALDAPNEKDKVSGVDVEAVTAHFTDDSSATFTQAGTYTYLLREARPFYDNDVTAIPGISYATEQYRMIVHVKHEYQQLKIEKVEWQKLKKGESGDPDTWEDITKEVTDYQTTSAPKGANPIVFTNTFNPSRLDVSISGKKVLESSVSDVSLSNVDPFTFTLEPAGVKEDRSVEKYTDGIERDKENFDIREETLKKQPVPEDAGGTGSVPIATAVSKSDAAEGDNVVFKAIMFSAENAGADREHAAIYKYAVKEAVPEDAEEVTIDDKARKKKDGVIYDESEQYVYIRVYKEIENDVNGNQMQIVVAEMCDANGSPSSFNDDFVFTNKYKAMTEVPLGESGLGLTLKKTIKTIADGGTDDVENRGFQTERADGIKADNFRFVLEPKDGAPEVTDGWLGYTYKNTDADHVKVNEEEKTASISIPYTKGSITFTNTGEYTYTLREINPLLKELTDYDPIIGFSYDSTVYTITIQVKNKAKSDAGIGTVYGGELTAEITRITKKMPGEEEEKTVYSSSGMTAASTKPCDSVEFVNEYSPYSESVSITGEKVLFCEDPEVKLTDFGNVFQFKLTPAYSAEMNSESPTGEDFEFTPDADQPMPDGSENEKDSVYKIVSNNGSEIDFGEITFNLDDVDKAEGGTTDNPIIYRYMVEELLAPSVDGRPQNALGKDNNVIKGTSVEDDRNKDRDEGLKANERYVYFKVYNQRQDGRDHVVVTRCNSKGEDITTATDFTITNTYKVPSLTVQLDSLVGVQKTLQNKSRDDQELPDRANFGLAVEAVGEDTPKPKRESVSADSLVTAEANVKGPGSVVSGESSKQAVADFNLSGIAMTFTKAGVYEYTLRELDPFLGDVVDIVPGVTYDYYRYKLIVTVKNVIAENALTVEKTEIQYSADNGTTWNAANELSGDHALVPASTGTGKAGTVQFVNVYRGSSASLPISGYKVLEGTQKLAGGMYSFAIRADGVATLPGTSGKLDYNEETSLLDSMPLPVKEGVEVEGTAKNGDNTAEMDMPLARGAVDFGMLTFTDADAGESASTAKIYRYIITENMPTDAEGNPIEEDEEGRIIKDGVTYDQTEKYLYIRVYKTTVVNPTAADAAEQMRQAVVAEFCNENGRTATDVATDFTFTNIYTAPPVEYTIDQLLRKALGKDDSDPVAQKTLVSAAGIFEEADAKTASGEDGQFRFVFYPASYPLSNAPMPVDAKGDSILRVFREISASDFIGTKPNSTVTGGSGTSANGSKTERFSISEEKIAFQSAETYTYRIRELDPQKDTDVSDLEVVDDIAYDATEYMLTVVIVYDGENGVYKLESATLDKIDGATGLPVEKPEGGVIPLAFTNTYTEQHTLTYEGNPTKDGDSVYAVPEQKTHYVDETFHLSEDKPVYVEKDNKIVVFVGWSLTQTTGILDRSQGDALKGSDEGPNYYEAGAEYTMPEKDVKLYAIWGYDEDGDGVADVLEEKYTLTYDDNPIIEGTVKNVPDPREYLLAGEQVYLAEEIPVHDSVQYRGLENVSVLFIGWTEKENTKIYARGEQDYVTFLKEYVIMPNDNVTLYAAWGYDLDGDGMADVLEDHFDLRYNGNARGDGRVSNLPGDSSVVGHLSGAVVKLNDTTVPTHTSVNGTALVFLGWTAEPDEMIYAKESETFPDLIAEVTFADRDITVYAAWGYDTNGNGKADILESYTLTFDENVQEDGFADQLPSAAEDLIYKQEVELPRGPRHSAVKPDGSDQNMDVAFVGWTETPEELLAKDGVLPEKYFETGDSYEMPDGDNTLYALWGVDANGNGTADVLDPKYTLTYDGNPTDDTEVTELPDEVSGLIYGERVELADGSTKDADGNAISVPKHEFALHAQSGQTVPVLFVGWSAAPADKIYERGDKLTLLESPYTITGNVTVYAVWSYDTDKDGTADVLEGTYRLSYKDNAQENGFAGFMPESVAGFVEGDQWMLSTDPIPRHSTLRRSGVREDVAFVGWTREKDPKLLERADTVPTLVSEVTFEHEDITVYAVWGVDENGNGTADALDPKYTLTYDGNPVDSSAVDGYPLTAGGLLAGEQVPLVDGETVAGADGNVIPLPKHANAAPEGMSEKVPVLFLGWTEKKNEMIYAKGDGNLIVLLTDKVTIPEGGRTVYAAWGYDTDGNGTADVLENRYDLIYDGNAQKNGEVKNVPVSNHVAGDLSGATVELDLDTAPKHTDVNGTDVVFIGWTLEQTKEIYTKDSPAAPVTVERVTFRNDDITVYAAWGYDENGNGIADVLETKYTLTYHGNAHEDGAVSGMPGSASISGILWGTELSLSDAKPRLALPSGEDVIFLGWTRAQSGKIYDVSDEEPLMLGDETLAGQLLAPGEGITVESDIHLYAAWAKDANHDGIADYLQGLLVYDGNPVEGLSGRVPTDQIHPLEEEVKLADGKSVTLPGSETVIPLPTHSDVDGRKVAFLGWTAEQTDDIYERTDESLLPEWITSVTMTKKVMVYAAWGYDDNRNGTPDVLEELYTLTYVGNAQQGGTVDGTPEARTNLLTGERVLLVDGRTVTDADGIVIALPTHSAMDYTDAVTGMVTEDVPVLFVAWTRERIGRILAGGDEVPQGRVTEVEIEDNTEVYAAWGYDANGNTIPDVFENERIFYAANGITSDADVAGLPDPNPQTGLFDGQTVELSSQKPVHEDVDGSKVLFLGWTTTQNTEIYEEGHNAPACVDEVVIDRRETTVYAAWAFDRNENNVPDVIEKCRLTYDGNRIVGEVSNVPEERTDLTYLDVISLSGVEPEHSDVNDTAVLFLGWTDTPTNVIYAKGAQAPDCVAQVRMNRAVVTVYAAWGFDENGNGIPDVREDYRLIYDANAQAGGTVTNMPLNVTGLLSSEGGALSKRIPQHTPVVLDGKETKVVFIGWTTERTQGIYSKPDTAPVCVDSFMISDENVTVYAAWGYDTDESGRADVLEGKYSLTYEGNPISGEATGVPEDDGWYLVGEDITLMTGEIAHSEVDGRAVVFLGWSLTKPEEIFEPQAAADIQETLADMQTVPTLVDRVTMEEGGLTVYAVWSYAEPLEEIKVSISLAGTKRVSQSVDLTDPFTMQGGEFSFAVIPASANPENDPVGETVVSNAADGSIPLIDAVYQETGMYQYTIEELDDSEIPGMQYDDSVYEVTVTMTGSGREAQADIAITRNGRTAENILFENTYAPAVASVSIEGRKTLTGRNLESGEFTFVLEPVSAEVEEEAEGQNPVSAIAAEAGFGMEDSAQSETQTQTETPAQSETQAQTEAPAQSEEMQAQTEAPAQSETQAYTEVPAQSEEMQAQTEEPEQSEETQAQTEEPEQSETQTQTEAPVQSEETQAQTELVLTCTYVPHTHTEECLNEAGMLVCGYADYVVHTHNEDCYDTYGNLVCMLPELEEHQHDESCYEWKDELVCGLLEGDGHTHSDSCYTVDMTLICGLEETPGHTHSDSCYTVDTTLICGLEETAGHFHDEYCYDEDGNLICGWEESEGHSHTDSCYQKDYRLVCGLEETPGHVHSDSCYERTSYLSCGQEEMPAHHHDASCYLSVQQCDKPEVILHKHSKKCYKRVYNEEEEKWESVLSCGKLEVLEHVHGPECFTAAEVQQPPENSVDIIADASEEELNLGASDGISEPEVDASGSVVTGGLQIVSVEVVPTEPSGQSMPEPAAESETTTEAVTEAGSGTEAMPELAAESETATEAVTEAASGTEVTPEPAAESETATEAVTEAASGTEVTPEPAAESETATEAVTEAASGTEVTPEPAAESETATEAVTEAASGTEAVPEPAAESETTAETMAEEAAESETAGETISGPEQQAGVQTLSLDEAMQQANKLTVTRALEAEDIPMPASPEAQNTAAGVFRFGAIEYTKPGVYTYRISEKNTKAEGIVFDDTVYYATVTVTEEQAGVLRSAAEIRTESGDVVPDAVFANTYLPPVPGIVKAQSVNDGPILEETQNVYEGDKITYYLTVTNSAAAGAAAAKDVVVSDAIPSGLEMVANSISDGGKLENRVITWELGNIPAGGSRTVSFSVTAPQVQTNIVRTNMANVRASNSPSGANVWSGSNVVRINVLALRPKSPDTPDTKDPEQTEQENRETEKNTESESESEKKESRENETEEEETDAVVPPASDERNTGEGQGSLGGSSAGGSDGNAAVSAAKTGDETNAAFWLTLMLAAGAVLVLQSLRLLFCRPKCRET